MKPAELHFFTCYTPSNIFSTNTQHQSDASQNSTAFNIVLDCRKPHKTSDICVIYYIIFKTSWAISTSFQHRRTHYGFRRYSNITIHCQHHVYDVLPYLLQPILFYLPRLRIFNFYKFS